MSTKKVKAYCCECGKEIDADIVGGDIVYPHRKDLYSKKFYLCPHCHNYAGVYQEEKPVIPTKYIRNCRYTAHRALDRIWHSKKLKKKYYAYMNNIVEQYTGLKDKNGKMIYEGDIVKMPDWAVEPKYKKVSFVKLSCGFEPFVNGCFECVSPDSEEVEVIGNIHENPELLEKRR